MRRKYYSRSIPPKIVASVCHGFLILLMIPIIVNSLTDHQIQDQQYGPGDTQDSPSNTADQPPYDQSGSPDLREDSLQSPSELSVIRLNDTSVVLRWEFPDQAQEHILYFKVQYRPIKKGATWKTDPQEIMSLTRAYQINGLRPGNYLFIVIAVYENQDNAPSTAFKFKLRAQSKIPEHDMPEMKAPEIFWKEAQTDYFRFKWRYEPKNSDFEDYGFLVYYRSAHTVTDFTIYNTMDTNVEIAELEPDTTFEAKVAGYNENGISKFSDTISIKTKPAKNESMSTSPGPDVTTASTIEAQTSPTTPAQSTTKRPSVPFNEITTQAPNQGQATSKPTTGPTPPITNSVSFTESMIAFFKPIFTDQGDAMLIVRCLLLVLFPVLFITFGLIFCVRPTKSKKEPRSSSSTDDAQFDLEINGYFKNSFPGVENEYTPAKNRINTGFINNEFA